MHSNIYQAAYQAGDSALQILNTPVSARIPRRAGILLGLSSAAGLLLGAGKYAANRPLENLRHAYNGLKDAKAHLKAIEFKMIREEGSPLPPQLYLDAQKKMEPISAALNDFLDAADGYIDSRHDLLPQIFGSVTKVSVSVSPRNSAARLAQAFKKIEKLLYSIPAEFSHRNAMIILQDSRKAYFVLKVFNDCCQRMSSPPDLA